MWGAWSFIPLPLLPTASTRASHQSRSAVPLWEQKTKSFAIKGNLVKQHHFQDLLNSICDFASLYQGKLLGQLPTYPHGCRKRSQATQTQRICWTATVVWCQGCCKKRKKQTLILHKKPEWVRERTKILFLNALIRKGSYKLVQFLVTAQRSSFKTQWWRYAAQKEGREKKKRLG